jgi:hypothetical protein
LSSKESEKRRKREERERGKNGEELIINIFNIEKG